MIPKTFFQNVNNPAFEPLSFLRFFRMPVSIYQCARRLIRFLLLRRNRVEGQQMGKNTKLRRLAEK